jgi:hypothetical protein
MLRDRRSADLEVFAKHAAARSPEPKLNDPAAGGVASAANLSMRPN